MLSFVHARTHGSAFVDPRAASGAAFADLGDFALESGQTIRNCKIGYRTFGSLNPERSNAVLFPTWFSGRTEDLEGLIGPGKLVDSSKFYVIAVDALGDGVSSSPSNGQSPFPMFTIRDMVKSQHTLLVDHLKISHLHAVIGISMGGMQTFEWMADYPEFFDIAVPIIGSPRLTATDLLLWQAELSAIDAAANCHCNPQSAMETVNAIHQFALYTPEYRATHTSPAEFAAFKAATLDAPGQMTAADWASQLRAMMSMDIGRGNGGSLDAAASRVKAKTLVVISEQDHMVNPIPARNLAEQIHATTLELHGNCGHMATSCEAFILYPVVGAFLAGI